MSSNKTVMKSEGQIHKQWQTSRLCKRAATLPPVAASLEAWWDFAGDWTDSYGGNDLTPYGASLQPFENSGEAVFDGVDDFASAGDLWNWDQGQAFTIAARLSNPIVTAGGTILSRAVFAFGPVGWGVVVDNTGALVLYVANSWLSMVYVTTAAGDIVTGQTVHVVGTYDGSGLAAGVGLYIDGAKQPNVVSADTLGANSILNAGEAMIGAFGDPITSLAYYRGGIDYVGLWSRELSPDEVSELNAVAPLGYNGISCVMHKQWTGEHKR